MPSNSEPRNVASTLGESPSSRAYAPTRASASRYRLPLGDCTTTYTTLGCTAAARFDGSVHGVVVQTSSSAPDNAAFWSAVRSAFGTAVSRRPTVTAGSCRSRYVSSILVSVFDKGVSHRQQYHRT